MQATRRRDGRGEHIVIVIIVIIVIIHIRAHNSFPHIYRPHHCLCSTWRTHSQSTVLGYVVHDSTCKKVTMHTRYRAAATLMATELDAGTWLS